jgi:hypothetical protein
MLPIAEAEGAGARTGDVDTADVTMAQVSEIVGLPEGVFWVALAVLVIWAALRAARSEKGALDDPRDDDDGG